MLILYSLLAAVAVCPLAWADVKFTSPSGGDKIDGSSTITIEWEESGVSPSIADLTTYQLFLCTGGNDDPVILGPPLNQGTLGTSTSTSATIQESLGANTPNAYFLKMLSTVAAGGTVINYSDRFTITGMTGTFDQAVVNELGKLSGTDGPPTVNGATGAVPTAGADGQFGVPYALQTGPTKYAPMAKMPPTKISKKNPTPQNPTSSFVMATTYLPPGSIATTVMQSQTASFASRENTAAAAPNPSDDMARFLARWKD